MRWLAACGSRPATVFACSRAVARGVAAARRARHGRRGPHHARKANALADEGESPGGDPRVHQGVRAAQAIRSCCSTAPSATAASARTQKAVDDYREFLAGFPAAPNRADIEAKIAALEKKRGRAAGHSCDARGARGAVARRPWRTPKPAAEPPPPPPRLLPRPACRRAAAGRGKPAAPRPGASRSGRAGHRRLPRAPPPPAGAGRSARADGAGHATKPGAEAGHRRSGLALVALACSARWSLAGAGAGTYFVLDARRHRPAALHARQLQVLSDANTSSARLSARGAASALSLLAGGLARAAKPTRSCWSRWRATAAR